MPFTGAAVCTRLSNSYAMKNEPAPRDPLRPALFLIPACILLLCSCTQYFKNDYVDNSPTSGRLKVVYDEGLSLHARNQAFTFESQYPNAHLELFSSSESDAVQDLYNDSCQAILISRGLTTNEKNAFGNKGFFPKYSAVAYSGVALITSSATAINRLSYEQIIELLSKSFSGRDSANNPVPLSVILDKNNSSVVHYLADSILKGIKFSSSVNILNSTLESINYVAKNKNTVAFIDFAWLSDVDDSISKANKSRIKFICISGPSSSNAFEYPSQSSFKLNTYPFRRTVYLYRKTGDFTLAKGFESFVAGPKGQLTFLKQGLMPARQSERAIKINMSPLHPE